MRPHFSLATILRKHFLQQWFSLSDPGIEEAFFDVPLNREFCKIQEFSRMHDESTILQFRIGWKTTCWMNKSWPLSMTY